MSIVVNYYQEKTRSLLYKYGPGPRVHYHVGIITPELKMASERSLLQRQLTQSQEDMMVVAADFWKTPDMDGKRLLDVGAGLGGASLWMAMNKRAQVDSLVQFADHARLIRSFADLGGVGSKVTPHLGDAHIFTPPHGEKYDAIMAMESPCYFNRFAWFDHLSTLLNDDGEIWLEDVLLSPTPPPKARSTFDDYWKTRIGDHAEYMDAAEAAGFVGESRDITAETAMFWRLSAEWIVHELRLTRSDARRAKLKRSYDSAMFHFDYWNEGHYRIALYRFRRA